MAGLFDYYSVYQDIGDRAEAIFDADSLPRTVEFYLKYVEERPEAERPQFRVVATDVERLAEDRLTYDDVVACHARGEDPLALALARAEGDQIVGARDPFACDDEDDDEE